MSRKEKEKENLEVVGFGPTRDSTFFAMTPTSPHRHPFHSRSDKSPLNNNQNTTLNTSRSSSSTTSNDTALTSLPARPPAVYLSTNSNHRSSSFSSSSLTINECCAPQKAQARHTKGRMGLSKSQRIGILLGIDSAFFLVELCVGYAVHSLALVADSFHMLNDVLSLCVGLWAVRVANQGSSKQYTYGWQRAETLGALVNGVFLVALCLSIFLEAIQRFVEPQEVSNPKLVLIVGCLGLASNILGLFLFHEHGHSHGEGEHEHGDHINAAERGHSHTHEHSHSTEDPHTAALKDPRGSIADVLPQVQVAGYQPSRNRQQIRSDEETLTNAPPRWKSGSGGGEPHPRHRRRSSFGRGFGSVDNIHIHPASFRHDIIQASRVEEESEPDQDPEEEALLENNDGPNESSGIFANGNGFANKSNDHNFANYGSIRSKRKSVYNHDEHHHAQPKDSSSGGGHGHSHGDLNMRGVFLHVLGDALGNIGVIASALIIWLTTFPGRFYFDPGISLVITVIILYSAIPLCKAASRILLQAVPMGMSIDEIRADIESLDRVIEAHEIHVWQLTDSKLVASLHVKVDCEIGGAGSASYMHLAREIRRCLHGYGIHSSTIQPEFCSPEEAAMATGIEVPADANGNLSPRNPSTGVVSKAGSLRSEGRTCLLDCADNCGSNKVCCPPPTSDTDKNGGK